MGIENLIARRCTQTAVYWGNPQPDGYGGYTFDDPVEINCRWEDVTVMIADQTGASKEEIEARSVVYVTEDLDIGGMLYLGTLDDLTSTEEASPINIERGVYVIRRFAKIPSLSGDNNYLRKAYLTQWRTWNI